MIHTNFSILAAIDEIMYLSADQQNRILSRSIRREVNKLSEQWSLLIERCDKWKHRLDENVTVSTQSKSQTSCLKNSLFSRECASFKKFSMI